MMTAFLRTGIPVLLALIVSGSWPASAAEGAVTIEHGRAPPSAFRPAGASSEALIAAGKAYRVCIVRASVAECAAERAALVAILPEHRRAEVLDVYETGKKPVVRERTEE